LKARGNGVVATLDSVSSNTTIAELKKQVAKQSLISSFESNLS